MLSHRTINYANVSNAILRRARARASLVQSKKRNSPMDKEDEESRASPTEREIDDNDDLPVGITIPTANEPTSASTGSACDNYRKALYEKANIPMLIDGLHPYVFVVPQYCAKHEVFLEEVLSLDLLGHAGMSAEDQQLVTDVEAQLVEYGHSLWIRESNSFICRHMLKIGAVDSYFLLASAALQKRHGSEEWRKVSSSLNHFMMEQFCESGGDDALIYINAIHDAWAGKFGGVVPPILSSEALVERFFGKKYERDRYVNLCLEFAPDAPLPPCSNIYMWMAAWTPRIVDATGPLQPWHYVVYAAIPKERAEMALALISKPSLTCRASKELFSEVYNALLQALYAQYCFFVNADKPQIPASCADRLHLSRVAIAHAAMLGTPIRDGKELDQKLQTALNVVKSANEACVRFGETGGAPKSTAAVHQ